MEENLTQHSEHRDDYASRFGMWLFLFTEILLFGGLFLVYSVYRSMFPELFHKASQELSVVIGTINTVVLLISSMTVAMSITAMQQNRLKLCKRLIFVTLFFGLIFLINKYFEWATKFEHGLIPGSEHMLKMEHGELIYFSLYFCMTGLHALHIIIGMVLLSIILIKINKGRIHPAKFVFLENGALYWHLVDLIWIFLFPLLYLIT